MREALNRYVRSLTEQELAGDAPEYRQDLGTLIDWLLERRGFTIHLRTFKHEGTERRKNSGKIQYGVDILASKLDDDGVPRLYRFVLKEGKIGLAEWASGDERGSMLHDLRLAAGRHRQQDDWYTLEDITFRRFTVVAVHNGDVDREGLAPQLAQLRQNLGESYGVELEWWDAGRIVELALLPVSSDEVPSLAAGADASLLPPGVRPFARGALDSLRRMDATDFDLDAVDRLLDEVLPLGRESVSEGAVERLTEGSPLEPRFFRRLLSELALFAKMVEVEASRTVQGSVLPTLDVIERILCRAMEHLRRIPGNGFRGHKGAIEDLLRALLDQYVAQSEVLRGRLEPLLHVERGLAIPSVSEPVDYPLRALRFGGYLATAGLALLDARPKNENAAKAFANALYALWKCNQGGFAMPVCDDQIIELALIWELWLRLGMRAETTEMANALIERFLLRKALGSPFPALYQSARVPLRQEDAQALAETYLRGPRNAPPAFNDQGSTILPLVIYLAEKVNDGVLNALAAGAGGSSPTLDGDEAEQLGSRVIRPIYLQSWMPPLDASREWYAHEIKYRGLVKVFDALGGVAQFVADFSEFNRPLPSSPADEWNLSVIDRIAWKRWRTPPPMAIFLPFSRNSLTDAS